MAWWIPAIAAASQAINKKPEGGGEQGPAPYDTGAWQSNGPLALPASQPMDEQQQQEMPPQGFQEDQRVRQMRLMDAIRMGQPQEAQSMQQMPQMTIEDIIRQGRGL